MRVNKKLTGWINSVCVNLLLTFLLVTPAKATNDYSFTTIDYPGAWQTGARGINNAGQIVGWGTLATSVGFLLSDGSFTVIDFPAAYWTAAFGINETGQVVGAYGACCGAPHHGFLFSGGSFSTIDPPGSRSTDATGINNAGQIVGLYDDPHGCCFSFLFSEGSFTTIVFPGASNTEANGINNLGQIVGAYRYSGGAFFRGFLFSEGSFTTIDFPGASHTEALGINSLGQIVGRYRYSEGAFHGFLFSNGSFSTIDFPGASETYIHGINDAGQIVGSYVMGGKSYGFLATPLAIEVSVDIKPGSFPNSINLSSRGNVPVAVLSTATFDARTVDPTTVTLAGAPVRSNRNGRLMASFEDVNGDGLLDLVVHVSTSTLELSDTDTEAVLEGKTSDGIPIRGKDTVRVVP